MSHHYDVVCLGMTPGVLAAAALLARRTFRVLVVGEGHRRARYAYDGVSLLRRKRAPVGFDTPVFSRIRLELAEEPTWRRRAHALDPMFRLDWAKNRGLSVPPSLDRFLAEVDRVLPGERAAVAAFYPELAEVNASLDTLLTAPAPLFERGLFARRKKQRALADLLTLQDGVPQPPRDPIGGALRELTRFAAPATRLPALAEARLHGSWTRGITRLEGGEDSLVDLFVERIRASGGSVEPGARVTSIATKGKRVVSVALDDARPPVQAGFVLTASPARAFFRKLPTFTPDDKDLAALYAPQVMKVRTSTSVVLPTAGLPDAWAEECILQREGQLTVRAYVEPGEEHALVCVQADLTPAEVPESRERVLAALLAAAPGNTRKLVMVDSVHDRAPLWDHRSGRRALVLRDELRDQGAASEDPEPLYAIDGDDPFVGERLESIVHNAHVVGPTSLPALGLEGELVTALHVAQVITKSDRTREKMRRELWSKLEADS